ncbi:MAG: sulfate/molybdate ABC transporter ATP-binding protein [Oscillospiraceae bacterium]
MPLYARIEKRLGSFRLDVELETDGRTLALLGASGCGKSMTLKCIAGIERPDRGRIILNGKTLFDSEKHIDLPPQKRRVGYLFQQYALFPNMTVEQNVMAGVREGSRKEKLRTARAKIAEMQLEGLEKKKPTQLSGGQQQRVALARILVNEPELLLLDEPFSALDSHLRSQLEYGLRDTLRQYGADAVFVSHDRNEAFRISDTIAVMDKGSIADFGEKHRLFKSPRTRQSARMTGCENIAACRAEGGQLLCPDLGLRLDTAQGAAYIGLRADDILLGGGENELLCSVEKEIENPDSVTLLLKAPGAIAPITVKLSAADRVKVRSESVTVHFPSEKLLFLEE